MHQGHAERSRVLPGHRKSGVKSSAGIRAIEFSILIGQCSHMQSTSTDLGKINSGIIATAQDEAELHKHQPIEPVYTLRFSDDEIEEAFDQNEFCDATLNMKLMNGSQCFDNTDCMPTSSTVRFGKRTFATSTSTRLRALQIFMSGEQTITEKSTVKN